MENSELDRKVLVTDKLSQRRGCKYLIKYLKFLLKLQDILRCRVMTTGIFETKFEVDKVRFQ